MSITTITKDNPKRWVLIQNNKSGSESLKCFGHVGLLGEKQLITGQPNVNAFLNEDTLEAFVNSIAGNDNFYKEAAETESELFLGESNKYPPI